VAAFPLPVVAAAARQRDVLVEARRWPRPAAR